MWRVPDGGRGGTQKEAEFFLIGKSLIEIAVQHREVVEGIKSDITVCMNRTWWVYSQW